MKEPDLFDKLGYKQIQKREDNELFAKFMLVYMPSLRHFANEIDPSGQNHEDLIQHGIAFIYPNLNLLSFGTEDGNLEFSQNIADLIFAQMQEYYESSLKPFEISGYIHDRLMGTGAVSEGEDAHSLMERLHIRRVIEEILMPTLKQKKAEILRLRMGLVKEGQLINDAPIPEQFSQEDLLEGLTLKQIGNIFGLSPERIRQSENSALHKLRCSKKNIDALNGIPPVKYKKLVVQEECLHPDEAAQIIQDDTVVLPPEPPKKEKAKPRKRASMQTIETRKRYINMLTGLRMNYDDATNKGRYPLSIWDVEYAAQPAEGLIKQRLELIRVLNRTYKEARLHFQEINFPKTRYPLDFHPQFMDQYIWSHPQSMIKLTNRLYLHCMTRESKGEHMAVYNFIRPVDAKRLLLCMFKYALQEIDFEKRKNGLKPGDNHESDIRRNVLIDIIKTAIRMRSKNSVSDIYEEK